MFELLRGHGVQPWVVGTLRGLVEAIVMGGLIAGYAYLTDQAPADLAPWAPVLFLVIRAAEGAADNIDPAKARAPK